MDEIESQLRRKVNKLIVQKYLYPPPNRVIGKYPEEDGGLI